jgi:hypothetical protein
MSGTQTGSFKRGLRVLAFLTALVGCSGKAEPAVDLMQTDADHRPGTREVTKSREPTPMPEEPEAPIELPQ